MPYKLERVNDYEWVVIDKDTNEEVDGPYHRRDAENAMKRLEDAEQDSQPASDYYDELDTSMWVPSARSSGSGRPFEGKMKSLKDLLEMNVRPECPMCKTDHSDPSNDCDYEECGHCGFDHSYERVEAVAWHNENDPTNSMYENDEILEVDEQQNVSIDSVVADVEESYRGFSAANKYTPFSKWYKGDHGKARTKLMKALKVLIKVCQSGNEADKELGVAAKEYLDGMIAKSTPHGFPESLKKWHAAKAEPKNESVGFDRFMDRILIQETHDVKHKNQADSLMRERANRHQDRPMNKTRFGTKR
jgi:hypothetical protein